MLDKSNIVLIDCGHITFHVFFRSYNIYMKHIETQIESERNRNDPSNEHFELVEEMRLFLKINFDEESTLYTDSYFLEIILNQYILFTKRIKYQYNTQFNDIYFIRDSPYETVWRREYYDKYKSGRSKTKFDKKVFNLKKFFTHVYEKVFPYLVEKFKIKYLRVLHAEADDIISIITNYIPTYIRVFIISSDCDFLQLLTRKNTFIYSLKGDLINKKLFDKSPEEKLLIKIIAGDKSDNVPPCFDDENDTNYYLNNPDHLLTLLETDQKIMEQFNRNRILIDFSFIPEEIKGNTIELFNATRKYIKIHKNT